MKRKIAIIGLGYVGLPLAVALGKKTHVIGFDTNKERVSQLKQGYDKNHDVKWNTFEVDIEYTNELAIAKEADFYIIAVPTPVDKNNKPDLSPVIRATEMICPYLDTNDIVVFESTVYPGVTEDICAKIIDEHSGLKSGVDIFLGYSPERVNPGDQEHTLETIVKIVSGQSEETAQIVNEVYSLVTKTHVAPSIKVAEAAKVIENTQRDVNIALVNELAILFDKMGINSKDVFDAAATKWNFLNFRPGLVGGHCIGVDPYYLTYKAEEIGHHPEVILAGRRINDSMGKYIAEKTVKWMGQTDIDVNERVAILGVTFKENCSDIRNSLVFDIVKELQEYGVYEIDLFDPIASVAETINEYGFGIGRPTDIKDKYKVVIAAVAHDGIRNLNPDDLVEQHGILIDVKSIFPINNGPMRLYNHWQL